MISVDKHKAVRSLPAEKLTAVEQMMRRGDFAENIVVIVQTEWKLLAGMKPETLQRALTRYRADLVKDQVAEMLGKKGLLDKVTMLARRVDVLDEQYRLYYIQQARIQKILSAEDELSGSTMMIDSRREALDTELLIANTILKEIGRLQLETGVMRRVSKNIAVLPPDENGIVHFRITEDNTRAMEAFMTKTGEYVVEGTDALSVD